MATNVYPKDKILYKSGEKISELGLIVKGRVRCSGKKSELYLEPGCLMGIMGCEEGMIRCDYVTTEETTVCSFPYRATEDLKRIFQAQPDYSSVFLLASVRETRQILTEYKRLLDQVKKYYGTMISVYRKYRYLCTQYGVNELSLARMDALQPMDYLDALEQWRLDYFDTLSGMDLTSLKQLFMVPELNTGNIFLCSQAMSQAQRGIDNMLEYMTSNCSILLNEQRTDLFHLLEDLFARLSHMGRDTDPVMEQIDSLIDFMDKCDFIDKNLRRARIQEFDQMDYPVEEQEEADSQESLQETTDLGNSLTRILSYGGFEEEQQETFRELLYTYRDLSDPFSTEDEVRKLRKEVSALFYQCYKGVVKRTLTEGIPDVEIGLFLYFGYMDASFAGEEHGEELRTIWEQIDICRGSYVMPFYDWLQSIYQGTNQPSLNEFDLDFQAYLKDGVKTGNLTAQQAEQWKTDSWEKVCYELDHVFLTTSKIAFGRVTTFLPVLNDHDLITSAEKMLVTAEKAEKAVNQLRAVDYSLFYRELLFSDESHGIRSEYVEKEILPYLILLPIAGSKGMMWQVTEGAKSSTAARIMLPILTAAEVSDILIENAGRYRWEMCRKQQGVRWNDITDPSLTSEFSDYIQYYRKNYELSAEAKEKIKNALAKAKNNYREVFVRDYEMWIKYESRGSFRLNKQAREILFRYCPFSTDIRNLLADNPMYRELFNKYSILNARKKKKVETWYDRYQKAGGELTEDLVKNLEFYSL